MFGGRTFTKLRFRLLCFNHCRVPNIPAMALTFLFLQKKKVSTKIVDIAAASLATLLLLGYIRELIFVYKCNIY